MVDDCGMSLSKKHYLDLVSTELEAVGCGIPQALLALRVDHVKGVISPTCKVTTDGLGLLTFFLLPSLVANNGHCRTQSKDSS